MPVTTTSVGALSHHEHGPADAPVLVLLHAFPLSSAIFDDVIAALDDETGAGLRTLAVDLPGLGASTAHGEPSVAAMAQGVLELLDALSVTRAVVLGISTGGYVALELAAARPELLRGLVLGSTTSRVGPPDVPDERRALAADLERTGDLALLHDTVDEGLGPTARATRPELRERLLSIIDRSDPAGVAWVARALAARRDTSAVVAGLDVPLLLLFGAEDEATPPSRAAELAELTVGRAAPARIVVLPATGHLTVLERPRECAHELAGFVTSPG